MLVSSTTKEHIEMTSALEIATTYLATWNEKDADRRRTLIAEGWSPDATYVDPLMSANGAGQINEIIGAVHKRFPDFHFTLIGTPDGHGDNVRFSWGLGPMDAEPAIEGSDVVQLREGRLGSVVGFLDKVPVAA